MNSAAEKVVFDVEGYLTWEEEQAEKHEYVCGEVFAMVGALREHVVVAGNIFAAFKQRLRGGPCQVYISDLKLRVEAVDAFFYPDVMVSCDAGDHVSSRFIAHPTLIVEVLSKSTAAFDRGDKFAAYRSLVSLQEYVLVDISSRRVETFRRASAQEWVFQEFSAGAAECLLSSLDLSVPLAEVFENLPVETTDRP